MRLLKLLFLSMVTIALASATTITINDAYYNNPPANMYGNGFYGDVIGKLVDFDIKSVQFSLLANSNVEIIVQTNYHNGDESLTPYQFYSAPAPALIPGDLLFSDASGEFLYGVPLVAHDGLAAGTLYEINDALTAWQELHVFTQTSQSYRPAAPVLIDAAAGFSQIGAPVSFSATNPSGPLVEIRMQFATNSAFQGDLTEGMILSFANMTCGNDLLSGSVQTPVPEPATLAMMGAGLVAIGLFRRRIAK